MSSDQQTKHMLRRWGTAAVFLGVAAAAGCDSLLDVDLPDAVTDQVFEEPTSAPLMVNSVLAGVECGYSTFALLSAGYEDNFQRVSGVAGTYSEYPSRPAGGQCDEDAYSNEWVDPFLIARRQGYDYYEQIAQWTDAEVANRRKLLGTLSFYNAVTMDVFGEHFCEFTIDESPLLSPNQTLEIAEAWADSALAHIAATGDYAISFQQGTVATSAQTATYGLRSRIRWAMGDLTGAAADAAMVPNGFMAYVLREDGEDRRNMVSSMQGNGGGVQAAGFLQGPVRLKTSANAYGASNLGTNPVTGQPWPNTIPFTGYLNLAIDAATGRAVDASGYPLTTAIAGTVADTRVQHAIGNTAGGPDNVIRKYTSLADDIPLINWKEMRLIQAQYQNDVVGDQAAAIALVNQVRAADNLPLVQGAYAAGATANTVEDMIIEERRRALWLEGRFWSTKILNPGKLWFPRRRGDWVNQSASYVLQGGARVILSDDEYQINPNLTLADRGTVCDASVAPVLN